MLNARKINFLAYVLPNFADKIVATLCHLRHGFLHEIFINVEQHGFGGHRHRSHLKLGTWYLDVPIYENQNRPLLGHPQRSIV